MHRDLWIDSSPNSVQAVVIEEGETSTELSDEPRPTAPCDPDYLFTRFTRCRVKVKGSPMALIGFWNRLWEGSAQGPELSGWW